MYLQNVFQRRLQGVFAKHLFQDSFKTSSTCLQEDVLQALLEEVLEDKKTYAEEVSNTSSTRLHQEEFLLGKRL